MSIEAAHIPVDTWDRQESLWVAAAEPTPMVHLGNLPESLRKPHAALNPLLLKPFGGFGK